MRALGLLVLVLSLAAAPAAARCLKHEPTVLSLTGKLVSKTVAGPPNYSNIARGDLPETIFILELDEPVCVSGDPASTLNSKTHTGVAEIQLVVAREKARRFVGKRTRATGSLSGARSGHHRTPVILKVSGLRADDS